MTDNIHVMPTKDDPMRAALERFKRELPSLIEMALPMAQMKYATFAALVDSGFSVEQALFLIKDKP